ncbi:hypothetical protein KT99_05202 [Shewanella benthica KT99]|uniref:Uncharacterized protein n=1 Tax=Shewanella benthica KT99 TaxID=314608 RepID=A9D8T5_9GAMM|nr:hypothetical protein KT99_05202 [Shewanella benthica KT99]
MIKLLLTIIEIYLAVIKLAGARSHLCQAYLSFTVVIANQGGGGSSMAELIHIHKL